MHTNPCNMETSSLRLRFTPLFQNIRKNDSKCYLEIVPEVSCTQNLDKIKWQQGDNSIEYTIPITYKVILRKKNVDNINDNGTMKTYHSCVDLLIPSSSVSDMDINYGDITKIISDTMIINKLPENTDNEVSENTVIKRQTVTANVAQTNEHNHVATSSNEPITTLVGKKYTDRAIDDDGSQFLDILNSYYTNRIQRIYLIDKNTSTDFVGEIRNQHTSAEMMSCTGTLDYVSSFGGKIDRKLSITPICSINTNDNIDYVPNHTKGGTSNLIVLRMQEPHHNITLSDNYHNKLRVPDEKYGFEVIKSRNNNSFHTLTNKSSERVLPEVRVAQFMKTVERELSPLKDKLNDMILKCGLLGFICKDNQNPMLYNCLSKFKKDMLCCKKESKSNRVVYSIVFDG